VISQGNYPGPPVVDDTFIYWPDATNTSAGNILKAPKTGGQAIILASGQDQPSAVAVDANNVYWVNDVNNPPVDIGGVFSAPLTGAGPVSTLATNQAYPNFLVVNGTSIFWGDHGSNGIERAALDGGQETQVSVANAPLGLALDGQFVYWADHGSGKILKAPLFGSGTVTIANGTSPVAVAINATTIVWANYSEGTIQSAPIAGVNATAATIATSNGRGPNSIVVDDTYVYWGDQGPPAGIGFDGGVGPDGGPNGAILYAPLSGTGALGTILAESANPLWITSDQSCIYWADGGKIGNGNISVVAKP
jgi:hypothetical protein